MVVSRAVRPRLVKPPAQSRGQSPINAKKAALRFLIGEMRILGTLTATQHRVRRLQLFEAHLMHNPEAWARRCEVMPYFRTMVKSRVVRSRPLSVELRQWLFTVSRSIAARELFRLEYRQHCPSVTWSPDEAL